AESKPASKAPSVKEKKRTAVRRSPTPAPPPRARSTVDTSKTTPEKQDKVQRRSDPTPPTDPKPTTPAKKKKDEAENRTAKEKGSTKKRKTGKYVDGNWVSVVSEREEKGGERRNDQEGGGRKKVTPRTPNKTSSDGSIDKKKRGGSETSKRARKEESVERSTEQTADQTADEKTQDSSARRKKELERALRGSGRKSTKEGRSVEEVRTEQTEKTEKTKKYPTIDDDNKLVSDAPKRKKYSEDKEENVKAFLKMIIGKGVNGLREEFNGLKKEIVPVKKDEVIEIYSEFSQPINTPKNRYKDVPRLNDSKVVLKDREQTYIHANYCTTPKGEKRFICTQGPNPATYNDFWSMVWQEEVEFIVMLCNFLEMGKSKCDKYFPMEEGEILSTDDFSIQCMAVHSNKFPETVTIRKLIITKRDGEKEKEHTVHHLHWESWPDRGVPPIDNSIFKLLAKVNKSTKPIVVHCSAGIGRTGTTVGERERGEGGETSIQIALEKLHAGDSLSGGIAPILKNLRKQRAMSVQTDVQYVFIHRVLLEYFKDAIDEDETAPFCAEYEKMTK
ncbi:hypothetical protein PMAYCL1PPCAC_18859, partial [Pristionchus mayeri]